MAAEDAAKHKTTKVCLVPANEPIISIEIDGQIESNKDALYQLGYRWADSTRDGLFGYLSTSEPSSALTLLYRVETVEQTAHWLNEQQTALTSLGYTIAQGLNDIDQACLAKQIQDQTDAVNAKIDAQAKLDEIKSADPRPGMSPLRKRIAEIEKRTNKKWNGKLYGRKGDYNFYVNNDNYKATDDEVKERGKIIAANSEWDAKYKDIVEATK